MFSVISVVKFFSFATVQSWFFYRIILSQFNSWTDVLRPLLPLETDLPEEKERQEYDMQKIPYPDMLFRSLNIISLNQPVP